MNQNAFYLGIPPSYANSLGGLRWSTADAAIEFADGRLFVFKDELALFLAGFDFVRALIPFGYVLHLLRILGHGDDTASAEAPAFSALLDQIRTRGGIHSQKPSEFLRLREAYRKSGKPVRNAGSLCARLCAAISDEPGELSGRDVCRRLILFEAENRPYLNREQSQVSEPPLTPVEFEQQFEIALQAYSSADLERLMKAGTLPLTKEGQKVSELVHLPPTLHGVLATLEQAPRLAGSMPFVPQMISALAIPPRTWKPAELPLGGYADITSRGRPEQILPGQFALDPDEFTRRFAENELLYFRREEPPTNRRDSLVLLLDQGVRTWGMVRSLLGAAALALARQAARRSCLLQFAATSNDGRLIDPLEIEREILEELVEATDLTLNPALALETVLEAASKEASDIVLLTHPRNLDEPDLAAAAARASKHARLFAVAADSEGRVEFAMLGRGCRRTITQIRVDLKTKQLPTPAPSIPQLGEAAPYLPWTGDVEPYGYPFWIGLAGKVEETAFDHEGKWIFVRTGERGSLFAARLDGKVKEILPLPRADFHEQYRLLSLQGVLGGLCLIASSPTNKQVAIAHYDCVRRRVSLHRIGEQPWSHFDFRYDPHRHSIVTSFVTRFDLALGELKDRPEEPSGIGKTDSRGKSHETSPDRQRLSVFEPGRMNSLGASALELKPATGELYLSSPVEADPSSMLPLENAKPVLADCTLRKAILCNETLLLEFTHKGVADGNKLLLLHVSNGRVLGTVTSNKSLHAALACDGLSMAYRMPSGDRLVVADVMRGCAPILRLERGRFHSQLRFWMKPGGLFVAIGRINHLIAWNTGDLDFELRITKGRLSAAIDSKLLKDFTMEGDENKPLPGYRSRPRADRFVSIAISKLIALADTLGHIWIFQPSNRLLCTFFFFRSSVAAWLPDGTRWGPPNLIGGSSTPGALEKISNTLASAEQEGRAK